MPTPTYTQIADSILAAIKEISDGAIQSYTYGGRTYTMLDLPALADVEQKMRALANNATNGSSAITVADMRSRRGI